MNELFSRLDLARRPALQSPDAAVLQNLADCLEANRALRQALSDQQEQARRLRQALEVIHEALTPFGSDLAARHLHPEHQKVLTEIARYADRARLCHGSALSARSHAQAIVFQKAPHRSA